MIRPTSTRRPSSRSSPLYQRFSHCSSLVTWRKHSPGNGICSLVQRSNTRYERTNSSLHMLSQSRICAAIRETGRIISNERSISSGGTLPSVSTIRSTSKCFGSDHLFISPMPSKLNGVVKQHRLRSGPSVWSAAYIADSIPPMQ